MSSFIFTVGRETLGLFCFPILQTIVHEYILEAPLVCVAPVCTTELGQVAKLEREFTALNARALGLSTDTLEDHRGWICDIEETQNCKVSYPIVLVH